MPGTVCERPGGKVADIDRLNKFNIDVLAKVAPSDMPFVFLDFIYSLIGPGFAYCMLHSALTRLCSIPQQRFAASLGV